MQPELRLTTKDERFLRLAKIAPPIGLKEEDEKRALVYARDLAQHQLEAMLRHYQNLAEDRNYWRRLFWLVAAGIGLFIVLAIASVLFG